jgi:phosphatidyl-myo-inositol alpha-mannosyltransferase
VKIALVSPYDYAYPGGVGRHVAALSEQFRAAGHQVAIIVPGCCDQDADESDGIYRIGRVMPVPANGSIARITLSLRMVARVRRILAAERFDVIHVHEPLMPALPPTVLRYSQAVNVGTFHAYRHSYYGYFYGRPLLRLIFNKLQGRIAVSRVALRYVSQYFPGAYAIIPNGVDLRRFSLDVAPIARYCDGRPNILFVGRWEKRKGLSYLIRAYELVQQDLPGVRLLVVGPEGRHGGAYREYVANRGLRGIEFIGRVSDAELPRYYRTADVFCAPSTSGESFGIVLPEAMASGKPVVTTDIEGYRQVVVHGTHGLLVPPRDERALADALCALLGNAAERERLGNNGRLAAQQYAWERVAGRVLTYYREVLEGQRSSGDQLAAMGRQLQTES